RSSPSMELNHDQGGRNHVDVSRRVRRRRERRGRRSFRLVLLGRRRGPHSEHDIRHDVPCLGAERRPPEGLDSWGRRHSHPAGPLPAPRRRGGAAFVSPTTGPTAGHGPARQSSSSPTASKAPLLERNRLPARSPWECTAPKRSSSAWTPGSSTRFTSIWLPCCWAQECGFSTISRTHRSSSGIRQSSPVWVSRICAIQCTRRRPSAAQGTFPHTRVSENHLFAPAIETEE